MALRFRKSIKLAPGIRMNLSASGVSYSFGARGASVTVGQRGTYLNTGIPGTGLYSRERLDGQSGSRSGGRSSAAPKVSMEVTVGVKDDGTVYFKDLDGNPLSDNLIATVKREKGDVVKDLIQHKCDEINREIEALGEIHLFTPAPDSKPEFVPQEFSEQMPRPPVPKTIGFFAGLFRSKRERLDQENGQMMAAYQIDLQQWQDQKFQFEEAQQRRRELIEVSLQSDVNAMESYLEEVLHDIAWPRETIVSTELHENGRIVFLDVDLPEIEDMPCKTAAVPLRGYKLSVKDMSPTQVQKLYMSHVHGIGFRLIGEIFSAIQNADEVILSAFSQRSDRATGNRRDEYLYSVRVRRDQWSSINFRNLKSLDVVESLSRFELRRDMSKTGVFKAIQPFGLSDR